MDEHYDKSADFATARDLGPDEFLQAITGGGPVNIVAITPDAPKGTGVQGWTGRVDTNGTTIAAMPGRAAARKANLYWSLNEPKAELIGKPGKWKEDDIAFLRGVAVDIDPRADEEAKPGGLTRERERIMAIARKLMTGPCPPSVVIDTGNGVQLIWLFDDLIENSPELRARVKALAESLQTLLEGDHTQSVEHVFRLPGTRNFPDARKRAKGRGESEARLLHLDVGRRYSLDQLTGLAPPREAKAAASADLTGFDYPAVLEAAEGGVEKLPRGLREHIARLSKRKGWQTALANEDRSDRDWSLALQCIGAGITDPTETACVTFAVSPDKLQEKERQGAGGQYAVSTIGKALARAQSEAARFFVVNPPKYEPEASTGPDPNAAIFEANAAAVAKAETEADAPAFDADPVDLWGGFEPPDMPKGLLPDILEDFARIMGGQMGADPAGLAVAALVTCAAAIPDRIKLKVKRHADWTESARLWAALVGPPSAKKSPILATATGPLTRMDAAAARESKRRIAEWNALPKEVRVGPAPLQRRLRIEDTTVEAAQVILEGSPDGVLCLQDELSGFFGAMDRYNGAKGASSDRAFWLRAFNGGEYALDRVGRGSGIIENLSVSILGGIQPEPLRKIAGDSVDDGLLQRLFPVMLRNATLGHDNPTPPITVRYRALVEALNTLVPIEWGDALEFSLEAQEVRRELEEAHLKLQTLEAVNRKLASHIGKYDGLFARLCLIWHCIEHVERVQAGTPGAALDDLPPVVNARTARRVADFLHGFLLRHAFAFYGGVLGLSDDHERVAAVAGYILAHQKDTVTNRDVQRGGRTMRGLADRDIRPIFEQLATLGWLVMEPNERPTLPPRWRVNPAVHARFAERAAAEVQRRAEAREAISQAIGQKGAENGF